MTEQLQYPHTEADIMAEQNADSVSDEKWAAWNQPDTEAYPGEAQHIPVAGDSVSERVDVHVVAQRASPYR